MKKIKQFSPKKTKLPEFKKKSPYKTMEWVEYRNLFLRHNPKCYACGNRATVVDHLTAWKVDKEKLFLDKPDNFIPLCKLHHDTATGLFDRHSVPKTEEKIKWLQKLREQNNIDIRVKVIDPKIVK